MPIGDSELILNADGSIYHLNLLPQDIAQTIIVVGDPDRVDQVSTHFDTITVKKQKREFRTHTGVYKGKPLSVISTGIGAGNIDIVLNELDALVNIDFVSRELKPQLTALNIIRIGTSGAIQPEIPVDAFLLSEDAIGLDGLLHFYNKAKVETLAKTLALVAHLKWGAKDIIPYTASCDPDLKARFSTPQMLMGTTVTNAGFYAPQGRALRLAPALADFHAKLQSFKFKEKAITNLEMETSVIYGLAQLLGHKAVSLNAILANRATGQFSKNPKATVKQLIAHSLEQLV